MAHLFDVNYSIIVKKSNISNRPFFLRLQYTYTGKRSVNIFIRAILTCADTLYSTLTHLIHGADLILNKVNFYRQIFVQLQLNDIDHQY